MMPARPCERVNVLGVGLSVINRQSALRLFLEALKEKRRGYIAVAGVHGVMESQSYESLRGILKDAFLCTPDGMPMVWLGKMAGFREIGRVYGPDFMLDVCQISVQEGLRHFLEAGANGVAAELRDNLSWRFPGLVVAGTSPPPFRPLNG